MTRKDIGRHMSRKFDITISDAEWMVDAVMASLVDGLMEKNSIYMSGLGTLKPYFKKPTRFRHPTKGDIRVRPGSFIIKFSAARTLIRDLNAKYGDEFGDEPVETDLEEDE